MDFFIVDKYFRIVPDICFLSKDMFTVAPNGLQLPEGRDFYYKT
jgi:hypothetical protein